MGELIFKGTYQYSKFDIKLIAKHKWKKIVHNRKKCILIYMTMVAVLLELIICFMDFLRLKHLLGSIFTAIMCILIIICMAQLKNCIYIILFFKHRNKKILDDYIVYFYEDGVRFKNNVNQKEVDYNIDEIYLTISEKIIEINDLVWIVKERLSQEEMIKIHSYMHNDKIGYLRTIDE